MLKAAVRNLLACVITLAVAGTSGAADEKKKEEGTGGMPPANVVVRKAGIGMLAPRADFIGTVYFREVSDVASEVGGRVDEVLVDEGLRVKKGDVLVRLGSEMLSKTLQSTRASHGQALSELERAQLDFRRIGNLYREDSIAERVYDEHRFRVKGLQMKADSLKADVERLEVELSKKSVMAPFSGVVVKKYVDRGEWISPGSKVATVAGDQELEVVFEVPGEVLRFIKKDTVVTVKAAGGAFTGKVSAIIPRGDVSTRTFPVKITLKNPGFLMEGMEAGVSLPVGEMAETVFVPRDAVITKFGSQVVFAVLDGKAVMMQVRVMGYEGGMAGVEAEGLTDGMDVVVKGNERIRNGQPVSMEGGGGGGGGSEESAAPGTPKDSK